MLGFGQAFEVSGLILLCCFSLSSLSPKSFPSGMTVVDVWSGIAGRGLTGLSPSTYTSGSMVTDSRLKLHSGRSLGRVPGSAVEGLGSRKQKLMPVECGVDVEKGMFLENPG